MASFETSGGRVALAGTRSSVPRRHTSPLRYPGSKRKMLPAIRQLIEGNIPRPQLFVEPFCGGASVSLGLLSLDVVDRVLLSDFDPLVMSFWREACQHSSRLVADMEAEPITLDRWDHWRRSTPNVQRERALKCLFLSRTTFSGIVGGTAGPIGGRAQSSGYPIDCRFNKAQLAKRIEHIGAMHREGRIALAPRALRWQKAIEHAEVEADMHDPKATMYYLDPPYIKKANRIYNLAFTETDHRELARFLTEDTSHRWVLSYDKEPLVLDLYRGRPGISEYEVLHHYTMQGKGRTQPVPGREIIFTNLPTRPSSKEPR